MTVAFALLARDVRVIDPRTVDLLGVFDRVELPAAAFPARLAAVYLVVRYEVDRAKPGRPPLIEIVVSDEDGARLFETGRRLTIPDRVWGGSAPDAPEYAMQAYAIDGLELARPGAYAFDVLIDGDHATRLALFARATPDATEPPAPPAAGAAGEPATGTPATGTPATGGAAPDDAAQVAALGAALAAAEARIHELDVQLASERQAADVRRGHLLAAAARAAAAEAALREVAALHRPGPEGAGDDRAVPVPAAVIRRAAHAAGAAPRSP